MSHASRRPADGPEQANSGRPRRSELHPLATHTGQLTDEIDSREAVIGGCSPGWLNQRRQPLHELHRQSHQVGGVVAPRGPELQHGLPGSVGLYAFFGQCWAGNAVAQPLERLAVVGRAAHRGVQGVKPKMVRTSVGLEHIDDILRDIDQALATASA